MGIRKLDLSRQSGAVHKGQHGQSFQFTRPLRESLKTSIFEDESECRYFDYFPTQISNCLMQTSSCFFSEVCADAWALTQRLLLKVSYQEEFARHGVLAVAALDMIVETSGSHESDNGIAAQSLEDKQHRCFALEQYAKSLRLMRKVITIKIDKYRLKNIQ